MELVYGAVERILAPVLRRSFNWEIEGLDRLPSVGPCLIASNHVSVVDPFVVAYALHEVGLRARFLAKAELFRNPLLRVLLNRLGQIPVYRNQPTAVRALEHAEDALWRGRVVVVFPEGTVGTGLPLLPLRSGTARLSIATGLPITPVATWGGRSVINDRRKVPKLGVRLRVIVGEQILPPTAIANDRRSDALTSQLADRLAALVEKAGTDQS